MKLSDIVSVTGLPGLYKASGKRTDGLIVTSLTDGSTKFVSGRVHLFSTLDNILNEKGLIEELTADDATSEPAAGESQEATSDMPAEEKAEGKKAPKADKGDKATKPKKESKPRTASADKPAKATSKAAGGGTRKTVTPRKAS